MSAFELEVDGRRIRLSSADRLVWREPPFAKAEVLDYYTRVAPALLPHLADRPVTLARFPEGVERYGWYQTNCRPRPDWVRTRRVGTQDYCLVGDRAALLWAVNAGTLELHPLLSRGETVERPTAIVLDLDPGPPAGLLECARVALLLREPLEALGLDSFVKTSGSLGIHVSVPLNDGYSYVETKTFARTLAEELAGRHPELVVATSERALRGGKVLVDWAQNAAARSTVAPYSLRAAARPTVSTPLAWEEVESAAAAQAHDGLVFAPSDVLERVDRLGDLFAPVLERVQRLPT